MIKILAAMALVIIVVYSLMLNNSSTNYCESEFISRFKKTKGWDLAQAVCREDVARIKSILDDDKSLVNFQEPRYGTTVLMISVKEGLVTSAQILLTYGADPNLADTYDGTNAVIMASGFGKDYDTSVDMLSLLLGHGGDPNSIEVGPRREGNTTRYTPLQKAAGCCLDKVKLLIESGANVNLRTDFNGSALNSVLIRKDKESPKILAYLLNQGADTSQPIRITSDDREFYIENSLRYWDYPIDSEEHKIKMQIVDLLIKKGRSYSEAPIPSKYYSRYSQEYLNSY